MKKALFLFSIFLLFLISCKEQDKRRIIHEDIIPPADIEISVKNEILLFEMPNKFSKSIQKKELIHEELEEVSNFLNNFYKENNTCLIFIIDNRGTILVHKDKNIEHTNIEEYHDFEKGLKKIYDSDSIIFKYAVDKNSYHVSSLNIKEIDIRVIKITPIF